MTLEPSNLKMRKSVIAILVITTVLLTTAIHFGAREYFRHQALQNSNSRVVLFQRGLNQTLEQHRHLPFILAQSAVFDLDLSQDTSTLLLNEKLRLFAEQANLEAIYLMDQSGIVIATSNAGSKNSFLGQNYGFRPYFQNALKGQRSDYFAIGATSGRPGYFVAEPLTYGAGGNPGVIAIKLDISEFQKSWENSGEVLFALNKDGIVVLASEPDWLYRPEFPLDENKTKNLLDSRQFGQQAFVPLNIQTLQGDQVVLDDTSYLMSVVSTERNDWTIRYLHPMQLISQQTWMATAIFGGMVAVLVGFATFLRSRRIGLALDASEVQRDALLAANQQLEDAQAELESSAQFAALGQLAASVTHELGQPISAFKNHLAAAEIGKEITSSTTAKNLNQLVDRMEAITKQFRFFARSQPSQDMLFSLNDAMVAVHELMGSDMEANQVNFEMNTLSQDVRIFGNKIQFEQAVVNLLKNALHAVQGRTDAEIKMRAYHQSEAHVLEVEDNGPGVDGQTLTQLQAPFYSTKPSGVGMGLGLAIATKIIRDHGGEIAMEAHDGGTVFSISVPREQIGESIQ